MYIPLQFWFNHNTRLALPICYLSEMIEKPSKIEYNKIDNIELVDNYELSMLPFFEYNIEYIKPILKTININLNNVL